MTRYRPNPTIRILDTLLSESTHPRSRYSPNPTRQPQTDPTEIPRPSLLSLSPRISFSSAVTVEVATDLPSVSQSISPYVLKSVCQSVRPFNCQPSTVRLFIRQPPVRQSSGRLSVNRPYVRPSTVFVRLTTARLSVREPFFLKKIKIKFQQLLGVAVQV